MATHEFYRDYYQTILMVFLMTIGLTVVLAIGVLYFVLHRPLPSFTAVASNGNHMTLTAFDEPNLLSMTITRWARKAAVAAYTFDFVNSKQELDQARIYFTSGGWSDYQNSISGLIQTLKQNQLFVSGVVTAPPVIINQGDLPGHGYVWRVQVPFLVTYQSSESTHNQNYMVQMTIAKVSTLTDPSGIGIDQFVMK